MKFDIDKVFIEKANLDDIDKMILIIHRCLREVNCKDYTYYELERFISEFNVEYLRDIISNRHIYCVKYCGEIIGMGGVNRDLSQEGQSYLTSLFINPDYHKLGIGKKLVCFLENEDVWCLDSSLIEIPSSKSSHKFYYKLGYKYRSYPPIFKDDGSTIMYKEKGL